MKQFWLNAKQKFKNVDVNFFENFSLTFINLGNKNGSWDLFSFALVELVNVELFNMSSSSLRAGVSSFKSNERSPDTVPAIFSVFVIRETVYLNWTLSVILLAKSFLSRSKSGGEIIHSDVDCGPNSTAAKSFPS